MESDSSQVPEVTYAVIVAPPVIDAYDKVNVVPPLLTLAPLPIWYSYVALPHLELFQMLRLGLCKIFD